MNTFKCAVPLLVVLFSLNGLTLRGADTYPVTPVMGGEWEGVFSIGGSRVKCLDAEVLPYDGYYDTPHAVYHVEQRADIGFEVEYIGDGEVVEGSLSVGIYNSYLVDLQSDEWSASATLDFSVPERKKHWVALIANVEATIRTVSEGGTEEFRTGAAQFIMRLYVIKPLEIEILKGSDAVLTVRSYKPRAELKSYAEADPNFWPETYITENRDPLPDVGVQITSTADFFVDSGDRWFRTDGGGEARLTILAPLDALPEESVSHYISGDIYFKAVKGTAWITDRDFVSVPYCEVWSVSGVYYAGRDDGVSPPSPRYTLFPGNALRPGDIIQVGDALASNASYVVLRFCNGQNVRLDINDHMGFFAYIGKDAQVVQGKALVWSDLKDLAYGVYNDPRRYGRIAVSKGIAKVVSGALDGPLKVPGVIGRAVPTPGSVAEPWIAQGLEAALDPKPNTLNSVVGTLSEGEAPESLPNEPDNTAYFIDIYSDRTVLVQNQGMAVRLQGAGGAGGTLSQWSSSVVDYRSENGAFMVSPGGLMPPGDTGALQISVYRPVGGSTNGSTPEIIVRSDAGGIEPHAFKAWMNGENWSSLFTASGVSATYNVTSDRALPNGTNRLEVVAYDSAGTVSSTAVDIVVSEPIPGIAEAYAYPSDQAILLQWDPVRHTDLAGYRVYRSDSAGGSYTPLTVNPLAQAAFLDSTPLPVNHYRVEAVDVFGAAGAQWDSGMVTTSNMTYVTPPTPTGVIATAEPLSVELRYDASPHDGNRWRIERATDAGGPFVATEPELVSDFPWHDTDPPRGTSVYYRVTGIAPDGTEGTAFVTAPVVVPDEPPPVTGLYVRAEPTATSLRWDPYPAGHADWLCVESDSGSGFVTNALLSPAATSYRTASAQPDGFVVWPLGYARPRYSPPEGLPA